MRRLFIAATAYMLVGVGSGLFYREFTKANAFEGHTQLALAHTHLLTLGFLLLLLVLVLDKAFGLSRSRLFGWFFWVYNAGVVLTSAMLIWHGMLTVLGQPSSAMIAGIAGLGHILISAGMILLLTMLGRAVLASRRAEAPVAVSA